jgi:hypothetical protein
MDIIIDNDIMNIHINEIILDVTLLLKLAPRCDLEEQISHFK